MSCEEMPPCRRRPISPAAGPLDDDDLLLEILLRLPPQPSSLPRASAVCRRWRRLVSDPGFFRRFRLHHLLSTPPLLGFFDGLQRLRFVPTLEAPNRVPPGRFTLPSGLGDGVGCVRSLGCRHGLFLIFLKKLLQVLVWDPVTGDLHRVAVPAVFGTNTTLINGAVLRAGAAGHFQVVLVLATAHVGEDGKRHEQALACVCSSDTGSWGDLISAQIIPPCRRANANGSSGFPTMVHAHDAVLAGDSLHWLLAGSLFGILEFDLVKQTLAVTRVPGDMCGGGRCFKMVRAEGGGLGFLSVSPSDYTAQLWEKRKADSSGVSSTTWVLARTVELDKLLSLEPDDKGPLEILGFAEENNVAFLLTGIGLFMIQLDSFDFKKLCEATVFSYYHPFESVYAAGACAGGGHERAEFFLST